MALWTIPALVRVYLWTLKGSIFTRPHQSTPPEKNNNISPKINRVTSVITTEAQRYHCKHNFTAASIILPPRDLFYCREFYFHRREIYFTTARFILMPRVLFYCREFYFTAASFVIPPRVLFSPPRVLFHSCEFYFHHREFYFTAASFIFSAASFILFAPRFNMQNKTRGGKLNLAAVE